jgi:hypothetical protein
MTIDSRGGRLNVGTILVAAVLASLVSASLTGAPFSETQAHNSSADSKRGSNREVSLVASQRLSAAGDPAGMMLAHKARAAIVPEQASLFLIGSALIGVAYLRRRSQRRRSR